MRFLVTALTLCSIFAVGSVSCAKKRDYKQQQMDIHYHHCAKKNKHALLETQICEELVIAEAELARAKDANDRKAKIEAKAKIARLLSARN